MLILIGLRGSGKTTLGRLVGEATGRPFTDLDDLTAARLGFADASAALRTHGIEAFRAAELEALREFLASPVRDHILSLGGGTPTIAEVPELLKPYTVVYLRAQPDALQQRLREEPCQRPSLLGCDPISEVPAIFAQRDPLYRAIATHTIDCDNQPRDAVVRMLAALLGA